ncbi:hypothetical protein ABW22_00005, partial [Thiobacillus denitrificans]
WGENKNQDSIGKNLFDINGALKINFKNDISAMRDPLFNGMARRAVSVAVNMRPLQKSIALHHAIELFRRQEKVLPAMLFLPARWPGGV